MFLVCEVVWIEYFVYFCNIGVLDFYFSVVVGVGDIVLFVVIFMIFKEGGVYWIL